MIDSIYNNFKLYFPSVEKQAVMRYPVEHYDYPTFEIVVELKDGSLILYDDQDKTIRNLPKDVNHMSESQCKKEFGIRLRKLMRIKHITQSELAELTGIPQQMISDYVNGKRSPSFYKVDLIAKALDCSTDELRYI